MVSKLDSKLEEFKNLYSSTKDFKQCLKTICLSMRKEMFSRLLSKIENDYPNEILSLLSLVPSNKSKYKYLVQYILDEMHLCPVCKKLTPKEQECCSRECQSKFIEVKERREQTCLKKYNVRNCFCSEELKLKSKETCLKKYNVEHPLQSELIKNKVKETNFKKYSCWHSQTKEAKLKTKETCLKKYNAKSFTESNVSKNKNLEKYGVPYPSQKYDLYEWIPTSKICNDRKLIWPYEIDILLPNQKLAIEFNGAYWHSTFFKDKNYHLNKLKMAEEKGYQLFNIFDFVSLFK